MNIGENFRDWALVVLPHLDYESQLKAINNLLAIHKEAEEIASRSIVELTNFLKEHNKSPVDEYFYLLEDERGEQIHATIYHDAAYSMAAVGMLAPFIESIFHHAFYCILEIFYYEQKITPNHIRFERGNEKEGDCHYVWSRRKKDWVWNIERGIAQISEAIGLKDFLPPDLKIMLTALFSYRNKMFHCGFEWPLDERENFSKRIKRGELPARWFKSATNGERPWIFYLSNEFIVHCLEQTDLIIIGIGEYVKSKIDLIGKGSGVYF